MKWIVMFVMKINNFFLNHCFRWSQLFFWSNFRFQLESFQKCQLGGLWWLWWRWPTIFWTIALGEASCFFDPIPDSSQNSFKNANEMDCDICDEDNQLFSEPLLFRWSQLLFWSNYSFQSEFSNTYTDEVDCDVYGEDNQLFSKPLLLSVKWQY